MKPIFGMSPEQLSELAAHLRKEIGEQVRCEITSRMAVREAHLNTAVHEALKETLPDTLLRTIRTETRAALFDYFNSREGLTAIGRGVELVLSDLLYRSDASMVSPETAGDRLPSALFPSLDAEEIEVELEAFDIAGTVEAIGIGTGEALRAELTKFFGGESFQYYVARALEDPAARAK